MNERVIVAIAGGTCAGKSTLAELLSTEYSSSVSIISQDSFYPDRSSWREDDLESFNWDTISSINEDEFTLAINGLISGADVSVPSYNRPTHSRLDEECRTIPASRVLVVEGLHAIYITSRAVAASRSRNVMVISVFVDCPEPVRRRRRMQRDEGLWEHFARYWTGRAEVVYRAEVLPQRTSANVILSSPWTSGEINSLTSEIDRAL
jgi:uridine kinase